MATNVGINQSSNPAGITDSTAASATTTIADVSEVVTGVDGTGNNAASKADVDARLTSIDQNFANLVQIMRDAGLVTP